jgi:hypothetical protein
MKKRDPALDVARRHARRVVFGDGPFDGSNTLMGGAVVAPDGTLTPGPRRKKLLGKQPRVLKVLEHIFGNHRVPEPAFCVRKDLRADIVKADPSLKGLAWDTLDKAIKKHNSDRFG